MNILDRFKEIKENYYFDSLKETDLTEQVPPDEADEGQQSPTPNQPQMDPTMAGLEGGEMEGPPGPIEGVGGEIGGDPMAGGMMGYEEPPKDPNHLGKVYELSKIYYRLHSIHNFLSNSPNPELLNTYKITSEAFDIFKLILNNINSYKDKIDDIILQYYNLLSNLAILLAKHTKMKQEDNMKDLIED